ncbi:MAG: SelB C-terminal domain-containing protein, partial [Myxococcota bacterium]|nr:SelB C-terminal domain-containing protein [Myxococcota bacterium]
VRTMVAGAGGVDLGLLVVSAEEGVMPQTREHLAILAMLEVPELVVALTRADLVDEELLGLAELDVRDLLGGTPWPDAAIQTCSGLTGQGVPELVAALGASATRLPPRSEGDVFRLPVDRSFSIRGFGTVVTGTTRDGHLSGRDALEILPGRRPVRLRGIQVHGAAADEVGGGQRVALNLQGIDAGDVPPGCWLATPGALACSDRVDVSFRLLPDAPWPLENNARVRFLCGTAELLATVRLMDPAGGAAPERVEAGEEGLAQLALAAEASTVAGDRFVLRTESPMLTVGGGFVLDPEPPLLRRRERPAAAELHRVLVEPESSPPERLLALLERDVCTALDRDALRRRLPPSCQPVEAAAAAVVASGQAVPLKSEPPAWSATAVVQVWGPRIKDEVAKHHSKHPLLDGPQLAELRQALRPEPSPRVFEALLDHLCEALGMERRGPRLAEPSHSGEPTPDLRASLDRLVDALAAGGTHPPPLAEATAGLDLPPDALHWLVERGEVARVAEDYYVARDPFRDLVRRVVAHIRAHPEGVLTPGEFKEISGLSRRHAIPFLEYLDRQRITKRGPDGRATRDLPDWVDGS